MKALGSRPLKSCPLFPDLAGKVALVTGSSRGIGAETARYLAINKVKVIVHGRDQQALDRVVAHLMSLGAEAFGCLADCTSYEQIEEMKKKIEDRFGVVSLLFAFAGTVTDGYPEPIEQLSEERWDALFNGHLKSKFLTVKSFIPGMRKQGGGSIVLMCSSAGRIPSQTSLAYSSAYAGVAMLTKNLAQQLGKSGIRVNAIAPSKVRTEQIQKLMTQEQQRYLASTFAVPRLGEPHDVAAAALFLGSDASSWITGIVLDVAGGKVGF